MALSTTALRVVTGGLMAGHGLQKLTNSFGGSGLEGTATAFEHMGFVPGKHFGAAAGVAETAGGAMLLLGLNVPLASAMITGVLTTAIANVHAKNGVWNTQGGFEHPGMIMAAVFAIAGEGGGPLTLDGARGKKRRG